MRASSHLDDGRADVSNTSVARALAGELGDVIADCRDLELAVAELFASLPVGQLLQRLQAFDLITQRLQGCANVLDSLADHAPVVWLSSKQVLSGVSLSAQVARLTGHIDDARGNASGDAEIW